MKGEHKRIVELAAGWEGSDAYVSLSPADAVLLKSVGAPVETGTAKGGPCRITGKALFAAARELERRDVETPEGGEPTPNQLSVTGPGAEPAPQAGEARQPDTVDLTTGSQAGNTLEPTDLEDDLDGQTIADLRETAAAEGVELHGATKKADIVEAIRAARRGK